MGNPSSYRRILDCPPCLRSATRQQQQGHILSLVIFRMVAFMARGSKTTARSLLKLRQLRFLPLFFIGSACVLSLTGCNEVSQPSSGATNGYVCCEYPNDGGGFSDVWTPEATCNQDIANMKAAGTAKPVMCGGAPPSTSQ